MPKTKRNPRLYMLGDELIAYGAIVAGCRFFAGYPITPASEIFETMMANMNDFGGASVQIESEIAVASVIAGASYAGARAMTATSGPGFSLMQEAISACGAAEIPVVIVNVQRGGPASGLPTRNSQEDLNEAVFGGHGDFPRIVLSPSTPEDCFYLTIDAFNLAERYQCPVILLSEQCVGQARYTLDDIEMRGIILERGKLLTRGTGGGRNNRNIKRYLVTKDGISFRNLPGTFNTTFMTNTYEHDEEGFPCEEIEMRNLQMGKRMRKLETARKERAFPSRQSIIRGDARLKPEFCFIGYGGTYGPIIEAQERLAEEGVATAFLPLVTLWPFPAQEVREFIRGVPRVFVVEQNISGQLKGLVQREVTGPIPARMKSILKFDGRPFQPKDILEGVKKSFGRFDKLTASKLRIKGGV